MVIFKATHAPTGERIEGYYDPFYEEVIDINGKGTFLGSDLEDYDYGGDK